MWRSTFVPETIFRRSIRLKQTDTTCWTIQTYSDELNWTRRGTFHELNSPNRVRLMKKFDVWPKPKAFWNELGAWSLWIGGGLFSLIWTLNFSNFTEQQMKRAIWWELSAKDLLGKLWYVLVICLKNYCRKNCFVHFRNYCFCRRCRYLTPSWRFARFIKLCSCQG